MIRFGWRLIRTSYIFSWKSVCMCAFVGVVSLSQERQMFFSWPPYCLCGHCGGWPSSRRARFGQSSWPWDKAWRILLSVPCLIMEILLIYSEAVHWQSLCQPGIYWGTWVSCTLLKERVMKAALSSEETGFIWGGPKMKTEPISAQGECVPFIHKFCTGLLRSSIDKVSKPRVSEVEMKQIQAHGVWEYSCFLWHKYQWLSWNSILAECLEVECSDALSQLPWGCFSLLPSRHLCFPALRNKTDMDGTTLLGHRAIKPCRLWEAACKQEHRGSI